jgi:hypothetical protein
MATQKRKRPGPKSLFHGKVRQTPVTLTLTPEHHRKIEQKTRELDITRADLIGLLIDKYADKVTKDAKRYQSFGAGSIVQRTCVQPQGCEMSARNPFTMNAFARSTKNDPANVTSRKAFGDGP